MFTKRGPVLIMACIGLLAAMPATANTIISFGFAGVHASWDMGTSTFATTVNPATSVGSVTRDVAPLDVATFVNDAVPGGWTIAGGDFSISMLLSNITANDADAAGTFAIEDVAGNIISGDITGVWTRQPLASTFVGGLSNVTFTDNASSGTFAGHYGSIPMGFAAPQPWVGTLIELSSTNTWFTDASYSAVPASVDASIVPEPASAVLIMLGLGLVIRPLRRYRSA